MESIADFVIEVYSDHRNLHNNSRGHTTSLQKDIQIQIRKSQYKDTLMTSQTQRIKIRHRSHTITFKKDIQIHIGHSKYIETLLKSHTQHDDGSTRL